MMRMQDTDYCTAVLSFKALIEEKRLSTDELTRIYERDVFPKALERMRGWAESAMRFDTLYLTAGTQPYSQALSIAATPADRIVFIATDDAMCQACVEKAIAFSDLPAGAVETLTFPEPFSAAEMTKAVFYHMRRNPANHLAADITSGRKVMSAALSSIASELEIRQFYLHAEYLRGGFAVNERRKSVPSVSALVRSLNRESECGPDAREEEPRCP